RLHAYTLNLLRASFANELAAAYDLNDEQLRAAIADLVAAGAISSDGFAGLRAIVGAAPNYSPARLNRADAAGRWFLILDSGFGIRDSKNAEPFESRIPSPESRRTASIETLAWTLLRRYGVIFRRLLTREPMNVPWR